MTFIDLKQYWEDYVYLAEKGYFKEGITFGLFLKTQTSIGLDKNVTEEVDPLKVIGLLITQGYVES